MKVTASAILISSLALLCGCSGNTKISPAEMAVREMRTELNDLNHAVTNLNFEVELLQGKSETQEELIAALTDQVDDDEGPVSRSLSEQMTSVVKKLRLVERAQGGLTQDLRQLKSSSGDHVAALAHQKKKLNEIEGNVDVLHQAMTGISQLVGGCAPIDTHSDSVYRVQSGDTLEKIARKEGTSVESIKQQNKLTSDMIRVGQNLKIR